MTTLPKAARKALEDATLAARHAAETAVAKRFSALDLTGSAAPAGIGDGDRAPRIALRRRAISLGQGRVEGTLRGTDAVRAGAPFLVEELAYESWHRMLFARFLAENGLLVHPAFGVALSVADVAGLAAEQGADPWQLAASFAAHRLPGLFHLTTPLSLAAEDRQDLAAILAGMDPALFTASDALGWTYQFWQAKRKDEVNASGAKIDGATLPPVTQLFTEDYIVDFLLQNSLGAWYVARHPETRLAERWPYLRYREDGTPAAGTFPTWPDAVREVTLLDPCCGSGHFLVAAFQLLTAMRQEAEGLAPAEAADAVLRDNLFGLELDPRCTQIATFAVALEAWKLGGHPERHLPHIACSGLPVAGQRASWEALAGGDANLRLALGQLHELFAQAGELGSLIDPQRALLMGDKAKPGHLGFVLPHEWPAVEQRLERALAREQRADPAARVFDSSDHDLLGTIRAARLLGRTYTLVATNVPYLSRGSQGETLKRFADLTSPEAKGDLATLFLERCLRFVAASDDERGTPRGAGTVAAVTPQNWLFLGAYKKLRQALLEQHSLNALMRLGEHGFSSSQAAGAFTALAILTAAPPSLDHAFAGIDAAAAPDPEAKAARLRTGDLTLVAQARQRRNPDQRIVLGDLASGPLLCEFADSYDGLRTGDLSQFSRMIWEKGDWDDEWQFFQSTVEGRASFSGREQFLKWEHNKGKLRERASAGLAYIKGGNAWGKCGIVVSQMRELPVAIYTGNFYDHNVSPIIPKDPAHLPAIWAFCSSPDYHEAVRKIDSALKVTNASLVKVPFDLARWQRVAEERYPDGLPAPHSSDPTQWLFDGLVLAADHPLQVAMAASSATAGRSRPTTASTPSPTRTASSASPPSTASRRPTTGCGRCWPPPTARGGRTRGSAGCCGTSARRRSPPGCGPRAASSPSTSSSSTTGPSSGT